MSQIKSKKYLFIVRSLQYLFLDDPSVFFCPKMIEIHLFWRTILESIYSFLEWIRYILFAFEMIEICVFVLRMIIESIFFVSEWLRHICLLLGKYRIHLFFSEWLECICFLDIIHLFFSEWLAWGVFVSWTEFIYSQNDWSVFVSF